MPTENWINEQMWLDYHLKQALLAQGDDENQPHEVDHGFLAADETPLLDLAHVGKLLLFQPSPVTREPTEDGTVLFSLTLVSTHCTTALYAIGRIAPAPRAGAGPRRDLRRVGHTGRARSGVLIGGQPQVTYNFMPPPLRCCGGM